MLDGLKLGYAAPYIACLDRGGDLGGREDRPLKNLGRRDGGAFIPNVQKMPLQIATMKEIEKERKRRYDTSDRHTSLWVY